MDEQKVMKKLGELEEKIDAVYNSAERTRKYFLYLLFISVLVIVLPLIGLVFVIPQFLSVYTGIGIL